MLKQLLRGKIALLRTSICICVRGEGIEEAITPLIAQSRDIHELSTVLGPVWQRQSDDGGRRYPRVFPSDGAEGST